MFGSVEYELADLDKLCVNFRRTDGHSGNKIVVMNNMEYDAFSCLNGGKLRVITHAEIVEGKEGLAHIHCTGCNQFNPGGMGGLVQTDRVEKLSVLEPAEDLILV